jgi:protoheme ferro-lyase
MASQPAERAERARRRIAMPNASPAMIRGLAEVVERELAGR